MVIYGPSPSMYSAPIGPEPASASASNPIMESLGIGFAAGGAAMQAIGAYYSVRAGKYELKSKSLDLKFQSTMAAINARAAEQDAQNALRAATRQAGQSGLQYRVLRSAAVSRMAASGVDGGAGSAAEQLASIDYARESDRISITTAGVRAANAARMEAVSGRAQSAMLGLSSRNMLRTAGAMSPFLAGTQSLLGSLSSAGQSYLLSERDRRRAAARD